MIEYAGLSDKVKVILGNISTNKTLIKEDLNNLLISNHGINTIDVLFIDHDKLKYLDDLNIIENCGLLKTGSVVVADNVLSFGQPLHAYLRHVRDSTNKGLYSHSDLHKCYLEYSTGCDYNDNDNDSNIDIENYQNINKDRLASKDEIEKETNRNVYQSENENQSNEISYEDGIEISIYR